MNAPSAPGLARHAIIAVRGARYATTVSRGQIQRQFDPNPDAEYGQHIYVYSHLQKHHVVYSLKKAMNNNRALDQLPFNGKQTKPRSLRKDLWAPLASIHFPAGSGEIGLSAYQKLREYRRRHELEWDDSLMEDKDGKIIPKKKRARQLCDQKANSIADMAAVLQRLDEKEFTEKIGLKGQGTGVKVEVKWTDLLDAEFAETWSENVIHDKLDIAKNDRAFETKRQYPKKIADAAKRKEKEKKKKSEARALKQRERATDKVATAKLPVEDLVGEEVAAEQQTAEEPSLKEGSGKANL
ncbi:transcriptional regulation of mitochondrial recombination-domain-containing protein [Tricladium varicosporioides]|nr:transcriptional regulation of mitochondrial recombination-domain-containing protein [Hymenoscyphus varicosporioides]